MAVTSPFIYYPAGPTSSAYDLRKLLSWVIDTDGAAIARFVGESSGAAIVVRFVDGVAFELAVQNAVDYASGGGRYVQPAPMPATVGGWGAGSTFPAPGLTMQQMWDGLLYPYLPPAFTSFAITGQSSPIEVGYSIPASVTFTWSTSYSGNVQPNSIQIENISDSLLLASGLANDGSEAVVMPGPVQRTSSGNKTFRIMGTNTLFANFTRNLTFDWRWRTFYGQASNPTLTESQIEALASSLLATQIAGTYSFGTTGFKYICVANAIGGQINSVKDASTNFDVPMATQALDPFYANLDGGGFYYGLVSVTNPLGVTGNYRVYRTFNQLGGAITLNVT